MSSATSRFTRAAMTDPIMNHFSHAEEFTFIIPLAVKTLCDQQLNYIVISEIVTWPSWGYDQGLTILILNSKWTNNLHWYPVVSSHSHFVNAIFV